MKRPSARATLVTLTGAVALSLPLAALPAHAETTTTRPRPAIELDAVRARCTEAIDRRFTQLDTLSTQVDAAAHVSAAQKDELHASIDATDAGLNDLRAEIQSDTERAALSEDCQRIVDDYRVYVLLTPQVHLLLGADAAQSGVDVLESTIAKLDAAITAARAAGVDTTEAEALLAQMRTDTADADRLSAGVLDAVAPLMPADYKNGTARPVLVQARADLAAARRELAAAAQDAQQIAALLQS